MKPYPKRFIMMRKLVRNAAIYIVALTSLSALGAERVYDIVI